MKEASSPLKWASDCVSSGVIINTIVMKMHRLYVRTYVRARGKAGDEYCRYHHRKGGYSKGGTSHLVSLRFTYEYSTATSPLSSASPRLRVFPFICLVWFFFFHTERERSVAEDEGFAEERHMKGVVSRHPVAGRKDV